MNVNFKNSLCPQVPFDRDLYLNGNSLNIDDEISYSTLLNLIAGRVIDIVYNAFKSLASSFSDIIKTTKNLIIQALWLENKPEKKSLVLVGTEKSLTIKGLVILNNRQIKARGSICFQEALLGKQKIYVIDVEGTLKNKNLFVPIKTRFFIDKNIVPNNLSHQDAFNYIFKQVMLQQFKMRASNLTLEPHLISAPCFRMLSLEEFSECQPLDKSYFDSWKVFFEKDKRSGFLAQDYSPEDSVILTKDKTASFLDRSEKFEKVFIEEGMSLKDGTQLNLMFYLNKLSLTDAFSPEDVIEFKDSIIIKALDPKIKGQRRCFIDLLIATFGPHLASRVALRYNLADELPLTFKIFKEVLIAVAARVTIDDLKRLYNHIQTKSRVMLCQCLLNEKDRLEIFETVQFQDLSYKQMLKLLNCFRALPQAYNQHQTFDALFGSSLDLVSKEKFSVQCNHDLEILLANTQLFHLDHEELEFALSEHLAKRLAYASLEEGMIVPILNTASHLELYEVRTKLKDLNDGMVAHFLTPIRTDIELSGRSLPILLNFRGTQTSTERTNAFQSLVRDSDPYGIGRVTFDKRKTEILEELKKIILTKKDNYSSFHLHINGHSLGGVDVQRALALVVEELAKTPDSDFKKIQKITAGAHNAPGIEKDINAKFLKDIKEIHIPVNLSYIFFDSDPIQTAGSVYLGAKASASDLRVKVVHLTSDRFRHLSAHSAHGFASKKDQFLRSTLDNLKPSSEIDKKLSKWGYWDSTMGWIFYNTLSSALFVPQWANWNILRASHTLYRLLP